MLITDWIEIEFELNDRSVKIRIPIIAKEIVGILMIGLFVSLLSLGMWIPALVVYLVSWCMFAVFVKSTINNLDSVSRKEWESALWHFSERTFVLLVSLFWPVTFLMYIFSDWFLN